MANEYYSTEGALTSVADAIRHKGGTTASLLFPTGYVTAINNLTYNPNASSHPVFTYTGTYNKIFNTDGSWEIHLLTSGTLTFASISTPIDAFLVGAGGAGGSTTGDSAYNGGGGGGGGKTATITGTVVTKNIDYVIAIGSGTTGNGGSTVAFGVTAEGGTAGGRRGNGGSGGCGGGGGGYSHDKDGGAGGTNGGAGANGGGGSNSNFRIGGTGQGSTTRAFGEDSGALYAGGGGGGAGISSDGDSSGSGAGGNRGGGRGGNGSSPSASWPGVAGTANTGGGGGGAIAFTTGIGSQTGGQGGSGIVIIRNTR